MPKFSVIIPVYNVEDYVGQTLATVLGQSVPFFEIVVIDDGSTDRSAQICRQLLHGHQNARIISQKNAGLGAARNAGLDVATGEYILFLDSDDYLDLLALEKLTRVIQQTKAELVLFSGVEFEDRTNTNLQVKQVEILPFPVDLDNSAFSFSTPRLSSLIFQLPVQAWSRCYKADILVGFRFHPNAFFEDNPLLYYSVLKAQTVAFTRDKILYYRKRLGSIMLSGSMVRREKSVADLELVLQESERILESFGREDLKELFQERKRTQLLSLVAEYARRDQKAVKSPQLLIGKLIENFVPPIFFKLWTRFAGHRHPRAGV